MTKYVVAYMNFFDNTLKIRFTNASNWLEAVSKAFKEDLGWVLEEAEEYLKINDDMSEEEFLEWAKAIAFNGDTLFEVKRVP